MSKAICFNCEKILFPQVGSSMEELLEMPLPIFCGVECSNSFPDNGTEEFEERIKKLKRGLKNNE